MLTIADEVFFTGTAAEVVSAVKIDGRVVGSGKRGPVTEKIQSAFFAYITGEVEDRYHWLTPVVPATTRSSRPSPLRSTSLTFTGQESVG